jgi:hypothetical protein
MKGFLLANISWLSFVKTNLDGGRVKKTSPEESSFQLSPSFALIPFNSTKMTRPTILYFTIPETEHMDIADSA